MKQLAKHSSAITSWPKFLYGEPFPSSVGNPDEAQHRIDNGIREALTTTRETADRTNLSEFERVRIDWTYALHQSEKELLKKPFEKFTIADVKALASWLTRLTAEHPGAYRKDQARWQLKSSFTKEEEQRLAEVNVKEQTAVTEEDRAFVRSCFFYFVQPSDIQTCLEMLLKDVGELTSKIKRSQLKGEDRTVMFLQVACIINVQTVKIHAFEEGSKRLGRLLMYIYLAQQGIEPITFYNTQEYVDQLIAALTSEAGVFRSYLQNCHATCTELRSNPSYYTMLGDILTQGSYTNGSSLMELLRSHPLHTSFLEQRTASSSADACATCSRKAAKESGGKLLACSQCKTTRYCSQECQKSHWPTHKTSCKKK